MDGDLSSPVPWRHWAGDSMRVHARSHQAGFGRDPPAPPHGFPSACQRSGTGGGGYPHAGSGPLPGSAGRRTAAPRGHNRPEPVPEPQRPGQRVRTRPKRRRAESGVGLRVRADPDLADDRPFGHPFAGHRSGRLGNPDAGSFGRESKSEGRGQHRCARTGCRIPESPSGPVATLPTRSTANRVHEPGTTASLDAAGGTALAAISDVDHPSMPELPYAGHARTPESVVACPFEAWRRQMGPDPILRLRRASHR